MTEPALAKRYLDEAGSAAVRRLSASGTVATSRLSEIEVTSAVERRIREGVLSRDDKSVISAALSRDLASMIVVELTVDVVTLAKDLLGRHPLRSGGRFSSQRLFTWLASWDGVRPSACSMIALRRQPPQKR